MRSSRYLTPSAVTGTTFNGTSFDDSFNGTADDDSFLLQLGGNDHVFGNDGSDGFYFGGAYTALDLVNGGAGSDTVALQGDYAGTTLGVLVDVEVLLLDSGSDPQFGDTLSHRYSYNITSVDGNVAAGQELRVQATNLLAGENIAFDGSAETDGYFSIFPGQGTDVLKGGAGGDGFFFGSDGNMTAFDRVDGGAGTDSLALRGNYFGASAITFQNASFTNIEVLALLSSHTNEYGGMISAGGFDYDLTMADGNVAAGQRLDVIGALLGADEIVHFDGRAETDGAFRVISGAADDIIYGGQGDDLLYGQAGRDQITAGAGHDLVDGGSGDDQLLFGSGLTVDDVVNGGDGTDSLWIGGRDYVDADFTNVANVESVVINTVGNTFTFAGEAEQAGIKSFIDVSAGSYLIDASAYSAGNSILGFSGCAGADFFLGSNTLNNLYLYNRQTDSFGSTQDVIGNFVSGFDRIAVSGIAGTTGNQINFVGNFSTEIAAEVALPFNSFQLNAVFVQSDHTLWFDINHDRQLDAHDLSIVLTGVTSLQPQDVGHGLFA